MWYVYVLKLKDGTYYKGFTDNLFRRLKEHNAGKCKSTRSKLPVKLIYKENCISRLKAREREKYFKSGKGREEIKKFDR